ncbi:pentapeptide repeat-containing protein [candidate division KSB1 bacterium]|nr:pentapeptide repeat-containing protein [candidate division KSB1 bacterium]
MADTQHSKILEQGIDYWNDWREKNPDIIPDLSNKKLLKKDLKGTCFDNANLVDVVLSQSNLDKASFRRADLTNANLAAHVQKNSSGVDSKVGYLDATVAGTSFGMANLIGAKLPAVLNNFSDTLKNVEETSINARTIFLSLLGLCAFTLLTTATVSDAQIILNNFQLKLPIIGADVPVLLFFAAIPILGLFIFAYMHMYLAHLWELVAELPDCFPDGLPLRRKLYPWMINIFIEEWRKDRKNKSRQKETQKAESEKEQTLQKNGLLQDSCLLYRGRATIGSFLAFYSFPVTMLIVVARFLVHDGFYLNSYLWFLSIVVALAGFHFHIRAKAVVRNEKSVNLQKNKNNLMYIGIAMIFVLIAVKFPNCNLEKVTWTNPNIQLRAADLNGFVFGEVNLSGANLSFAKLNHADFRKTNLQKADLHGAELKSAELDSAHLQYADFRKADLDDATFNGADIANADFRDARGLMLFQIAKARNVHSAQFDGEIQAQLQKQYPHLMELPTENGSDK